MPRHAAGHGGPAPGIAGRAAAVIAALLGLAACASTPPAHQTKYPAKPDSGQVGATLAVSDSSGTRLEVTVQKVIDPASGASQYAQPAPGQHFVGVKLHLRNAAATSYQNNANNETTITLSDGKTGDAGYNPISGCGNFDNGQVTLKSGASATGCVTFQVPKGVKVVQVRYANTTYPGTAAEWSLP